MSDLTSDDNLQLACSVSASVFALLLAGRADFSHPAVNLGGTLVATLLGVLAAQHLANRSAAKRDRGAQEQRVELLRVALREAVIHTLKHAQTMRGFIYSQGDIPAGRLRHGVLGEHVAAIDAFLDHVDGTGYRAVLDSDHLISVVNQRLDHSRGLLSFFELAKDPQRRELLTKGGLYGAEVFQVRALLFELQRLEAALLELAGHLEPGLREDLEYARDAVVGMPPEWLLYLESNLPPLKRTADEESRQ